MALRTRVQPPNSTYHFRTKVPVTWYGTENVSTGAQRLAHEDVAYIPDEENVHVDDDETDANGSDADDEDVGVDVGTVSR